MADSYQNVGYGSSDIGWGQKAAVLVVDWQTAFTDPKYALGGLPRLHSARDNTAALLSGARKGHTRRGLLHRLLQPEGHAILEGQGVRDEFFYGHPCTEMDPLIYDASDFTYCKNAPSMFFQTLAGHLPGEAERRYRHRHRLHDQRLCARDDRRCVLFRLQGAGARGLLRGCRRRAAQRHAARLRPALLRRHGPCRCRSLAGQAGLSAQATRELTSASRSAGIRSISCPSRATRSCNAASGNSIA
jgi:hypothetical protein